MNVLVFGGTGWVGHHIALEFHRAGYRVTIASRGKKTVFSDRLRELESVVIDKQDEAAMKTLLDRGFEIIVDSVPSAKSVELIHKYARGLRRYLHCSSTGGYAPLPFVPCDETAPYGGFQGGSGWAQKAVVDAAAMQFFVEDGFPATVIRPCYITGGGDMLPLDNLGGRRDDFIPDILAEKELDLPGDGQSLLQPIHVEDLAHAFLLAAETRRAIAQRYNICLDHALPLNRYLELTGAALGRKVKIHHLPLEAMLEKYRGRCNETGMRFLATHMCFTIEKARCELGYRPRHTPEETIAETARLTAAKLQ